MKKTICPLNAIMAFIAGGKWQHPVTLQSVIEVIEGEIAELKIKRDHPASTESPYWVNSHNFQIEALNRIKQKINNGTL